MSDQPMPWGARVLAKVVEEPDTVRDSGLLLPGGARPDPKPLRGVIVAIGQGFRHYDGSWTEMGLKVGDVVLFWEQHCAEIVVNGEDLWLLRDQDVLVVMERALASVSERDLS